MWTSPPIERSGVVSYGTRDTTVEGGRYVQQQLSTRATAPTSARPVSLGPTVGPELRRRGAREVPGRLRGQLGDAGTPLVAWARSSTPADPTALYHQTLYAAVIRP